MPFNILVLIPLMISTMVNGTLLNFGKRYENDLRVIFDQWSKLHLGLDALSVIKKCTALSFMILANKWFLIGKKRFEIHDCML